MRGFGAAFGMLFGVAHAAAGIAMLRQPPAPAGSGQPGAIPFQARVVFPAWALLAAAGSFVAVEGGPAGRVGVLLAVGGITGVVTLAVLNGYWMHGAPRLRHHALRTAAAVVILVLLLIPVG